MLYLYFIAEDNLFHTGLADTDVINWGYMQQVFEQMGRARAKCDSSSVQRA